MKTEKTYRELQAFDTLATNYLIVNGYFTPGKDGEKASFTNKETTKLVSNIKNIIKQGNKLFEGFEEDRQQIFLDNCAVDEKTKVILREEVIQINKEGVTTKSNTGSYKFTVEQQKKVNSLIKDLMNTKVEIHQRITEGEWELTDEEKEAFSGFVIPEIKQETED